MGYQPRKTDQKPPKVIDMGCNIPRPTKRPPTPAMNHPVPEESRTNCPNCCAVITGPICEYCGTRFGGYDPGDPKGDAMIIPVYIGGKKVSEVISGMDAFRQFHRMSYDFGVNINDQKGGNEV